MDDAERFLILKWVQGFYPTAAEDQLPRDLAEFRNAKDRDFCADRCPGIHRCAIHGYVAKPVFADIYKRYVIVYEPCQNASAERQQSQIVKCVESSGIPERYKDATFENYESLSLPGNVAAAKSVAMECAEKGFSLVLGGTPGTGKTHLACAMAKIQLAKGKSVVFVSVISLLNDIKSGFDNGQSQQIIDTLGKAGVVILDDLGAQKDSDWVTETLFNLIDVRYATKKMTVITTNATSMEQLATIATERGPQICSRMRENGHEHWMKGCKDYRSKVRQNNLWQKTA